jgi:hypothetical protein
MRRVLTILLPSSPPSESRTRDIVDAYAGRPHESVSGLHPLCALARSRGQERAITPLQ